MITSQHASGTLIIKIDLDNEAFQGGRAGFEVGRILEGIVREAVISGDGHSLGYSYLHDINGNEVGSVALID